MSGLSQKLEALLFISSSPLKENELREYFRVSSAEIKDALKELKAIFESEQHGIFLSRLSGGWVLQTKPELYESLKAFHEHESESSAKIHLSSAAIETAAIIAYNQPVTRGEIDNIRGVRSDSIVARLLEHGVIRTSGRKETGGALMFRTTKKFLEIFGLNSLNDLPDIKEIEFQYET